MSELNIDRNRPRRLEVIRSAGKDEHGNDSSCGRPRGGSRCAAACATPAPASPIALVSYSPFAMQSPWTEVGPVFIHGEACAGTRRRPNCPPTCVPARASCARTTRTSPWTTTTSRSCPKGRISSRLCCDLLDRPQVAAVHVRAVDVAVLPLRGSRRADSLTLERALTPTVACDAVPARPQLGSGHERSR